MINDTQNEIHKIFSQKCSTKRIHKVRLKIINHKNDSQNETHKNVPQNETHKNDSQKENPRLTNIFQKNDSQNEAQKNVPQKGYTN